MVHSFERVGRSLRADRALTSSGAMLGTLSLLIVWAVWAFHATVARYVMSNSARSVMSPLGRTQVLAQFPAATLGELHPHQPALFMPDGGAFPGDEPIGARLWRIHGQARQGEVTVEFLLDQRLEGPSQSLPGSVAVQVESLTPAILLRRSADRVGGN